MMRLLAFGRLRLAALLGAVLFVLASAPLYADEENRDAALDSLFAQLQRAPDPVTAQVIDQQIWLHWTTPRDPELALQMNDVLAARQRGDLPGALAILDKMVVDHPDFAEGWNQRATVRYLLRDFEGSLADIDKVLEHEPRHFGALTGRALIYLDQGKRALALKDMAAALEVHPFLAEKHLFPELSREMTRI